MEDQTIAEDDYEKIKKESKYKMESIIRLSRNEDFKNWVEEVVRPNIELIEAEIASKEADQMPEVILRSKLKQLNSLRYLFKDVFTIIAQQIEE